MHCFFLILRQFFLILRQSLLFCRVFIASISWRNENIISTILDWNFEFWPSLLHFDRLWFNSTIFDQKHWISDAFELMKTHFEIMETQNVTTNEKQWIWMTTIGKSENALPFWSHCIRQFGCTAQHASFIHETKPIFGWKWSQDVNVSDEFNCKPNMHTKTLKM